MKTKFKSRASITHIGGKMFKLNEPLTLCSKELNMEITAPKGFVTDFASIPRPLQGLIGVLGNNIRSSIIHDYLCLPAGKKKYGLTQKQADKLFLEGLRIDEVRFSKARVMYAGVRVFQRIKYAFKRGEHYG